MSSEPANPKRFAIAVSFPGEHRRFVLKVVNRLAEVVGRDRVFYDAWYEAELIGVDGDLKLRRYYREQSEIVVPFFSEYYRKPWCKIEWHAIRAMLQDRQAENAVIPVEMDGTKIEGWERIDFGIRRKNRSGKAIADLILEAYRQRNPNLPEPLSATPPDVTAINASGIENLKTLVTAILESDVTREFILKANGLPGPLSASELAEKLFDVQVTSPEMARNEKYVTPMDFLFQCIRRTRHGLSPEMYSAVCKDMLELAALLAPVSFYVEDPAQISAAVSSSSSHAKVYTRDHIVAKSIVALFVGAKVRWEDHLPLIKEGRLHYGSVISRDPDSVEAARTHLPESGISSSDIVEQVREGLAPLLETDTRLESVQARLRNIAAINSRLCLIFSGRWDARQLQSVKAAFPDLILLVCEEHRVTKLSETVLDQIEQLRKRFAD